MPAGQPTKYRPEMCEAVLAHLSDGFSLTSACGEIGIVKQTAYNYADEYPEFLDAISIGRSIGMALWEKRLTVQAIENPGNTAAIIFAMKNLYQDDWRDKVETENKTTLSVSDDMAALMGIATKNTKRIGE